MFFIDKIRKVYFYYLKKLLYIVMIMDVFFGGFLYIEMGRGDLRDIIDLDK